MMQQFISPELDENVRATLRCQAEPMPGYTQCAVLIRRSAFMRVGFFETDWEVGEFVAWYLKALEKRLSSAMLPEVVMRRRLHASNQGLHKRDFQTDYVRILKASLDRRREASPREIGHRPCPVSSGSDPQLSGSKGLAIVYVLRILRDEYLQVTGG
jgi:hypothetical protein